MSDNIIENNIVFEKEEDVFFEEASTLDYKKYYKVFAKTVLIRKRKGDPITTAKIDNVLIGYILKYPEYPKELGWQFKPLSTKIGSFGAVSLKAIVHFIEEKNNEDKLIEGEQENGINNKTKRSI